MNHTLNHRKIKILLSCLIVVLFVLYTIAINNIDAIPLESPFNKEQVIEMEKDASKGDIEAIQCLFYHFLAKGNMEKQVYWARKGTALGDPISQDNLYTCLSMNDNTNLRKEGIAALIKSAKQNNIAAQTRLAEIYSDGRGVRKDIPAAIRWYRKAAYQGDTDSMMGLLELLVKHTSDKASMIEAYGWTLLLYQRLGRETADHIENIDQFRPNILSKIKKHKISQQNFVALAEIWAKNHGKKIPIVDPSTKESKPCKYL